MVDVVAEAELAVLSSAILSGGDCLDELGLTGDDFGHPQRGELFDLIVGQWSSGKPVDAFVLSELKPEITDLVFSLTSSAVAVGQAGYYANLVKKHAIRRRLTALASAFAGIGSDLDAADLAEEARSLVDKAIGGDTGRKVQFVADVMPKLEERMRRKDVFVPSPWKVLDQKIGGFRPGAVYVIAARPGGGKTVLAGQVAVELAKHGIVTFSSLEMTSEELVARMMSERLQINVGHIKDSRMNDHDWQKLEHGRDVMNALQVAIDDRSGVSATDVRAFVRTASRKGKLAGVVVDYLQLMTSRERLDRHLQVADFSRRLKILAKDFQVPVIALSQLNRNSENTAMAVPKLSDLRESGSIEQDADVVMLLRREGDFPNESLVVDVAKNRHGETGEVRLSWDGGYSRAVEWE